MGPGAAGQDVRQLVDTIKKLEERVAALEKLTSGAADQIVLRAGNSSIVVKKTRIEISATDIAIKASGKVDIKGAKVQSN